MLFWYMGNDSLFELLGGAPSTSNIDDQDCIDVTDPVRQIATAAISSLKSCPELKITQKGVKKQGNTQSEPN